jgi:WD40 repeat protein
MRPYLLKGHERPLTQVKYNREGDLFVSCAKNLYPCLWLADDGTRLGTYEGHNGAVWTCDISADSSRLITSSADQSVRVWDLPTGKELHQIKMNEPCRACALSVGEKMLAFTTDSFMGAPPQIHIFDVDLAATDGPIVATERPRMTIDAEKGRITRVMWTDANRVLLTSHDGGWLRRWDAETGKLLAEANVSGGRRRRAGEPAGGGWGPGGGPALAARPRGGGPPRPAAGCSGGSICGGSRAAAAGRGGRRSVGCRASRRGGRSRRRTRRPHTHPPQPPPRPPPPQVHEDAIQDMQFGPDRSYVITASLDKTAKLVDVQSLEVLKTYKAGRFVQSASVSPLMDHVVLGGGQDASQVRAAAGGGGVGSERPQRRRRPAGSGPRQQAARAESSGRRGAPADRPPPAPRPASPRPPPPQRPPLPPPR